MTPVILLLDGYIANAAEPWLIPDMRTLEPIAVQRRIEKTGFAPYARDEETLARPWAIPGMEGLAHRIGGIERDARTGAISYDPANHDLMTRLRVGKVMGIRSEIPPQETTLGDDAGELAVVGWGGTFGPLHMAVKRARAAGKRVSHIHLRHLWPLPPNLGALLDNFDRVLVAELNSGQLQTLLQSQLARPIASFSKVSGRPFRIAEVLDAILTDLDSKRDVAA